MFREMLRSRQALSGAECVDVLKRSLRGVLSVAGEDGYPYGMPMNHWYCEDDGHIYFHGGRMGHKIDAVAKDDRVSFCALDEGVRQAGDWALTFRSVVVFGRLRPVEDHARAMEISRQLSYKFTRDEAYIDEEIRRSGPGTLCLELIPEHMTGKRVKES